MGDEITVFKVSGTHTGTFFVKVDDGGAGYEFDSSTLLADGKLRVTAVANGIDTVMAPGTLVDIYTVSGLRIVSQQPYGTASSTLPPGTYVVVGSHASQKIIIR